MADLTRMLSERVTGGDIVYFAPTLKKNLHSINAQRLRLNSFIQVMNELGRRYKIVTDIDELSDFGGIACSTDYYAIQVLKHLKYPKDVPVSGFDSISALRDVPVRVLSVEYSTNVIAEQAINYILGRRYMPDVAYKLVYNVD
jgi:DNA-binding LacI/PurR family transcriptional regulator